MIDTYIYTALGGILPALVWLLFWLKEDYKHPEPRGLIMKTFLLGMCAVIIVLPLQKMVAILIPGITVISMILWVTFEELLKFGAAYFGGLKSVEDNEPIDPIIYLITAALGFVALENVLFLLGPLVGEQVSISNFFITGNLRFIGASLLHVVSSSMIGVALAFSFYRSRKQHVVITLISIVLAIAFHTGFNLAIIYLESIGIMISFLSVWVGVILLLLAFEKAKTIAR